MYCTLDRSKPCPFPLSPTQVYLGEDEEDYYVMDGFFSDTANMFKRMVKFNKKSFRPKTIWQGVRNSLLTTMTLGAYQFAPKSIKKKMENVSNIVIPAVAAVGVGFALGPSVMAVMGPKLSTAASMLGSNVSTIGQGLFTLMGKLGPAQQDKVAQELTPEDIMYAERNQGMLPPRLMEIVDQAGRKTYPSSVAYPSSMYPVTSETGEPSPKDAGTGTGAVIGIAVLSLLMLRK